jgi:hypothetical protein
MGILHAVGKYLVCEKWWNLPAIFNVTLQLDITCFGYGYVNRSPAKIIYPVAGSVFDTSVSQVVRANLHHPSFVLPLLLLPFPPVIVLAVASTRL